MGIILVILLTPILLTIYLILFGGKECYECGVILDKKRRPIRNNKGKHICEKCWRME